jgi:hypothetical protein
MAATEFNSSVECCGRLFGTAGDLATHQCMAHEQGAYRQAVHLQTAHQQTGHRSFGIGDARPFKCNFPGCNKSFAQRSSLRNHESRIHRAADSKPFKCLVENCGKTFVRKDGLDCHKTKVHSDGENEKAFKCLSPGCEASFVKKWYLQRHSATKHRVWVCGARHCGFECNSEQEFASHRAVSYPRWFLCIHS